MGDDGDAMNFYFFVFFKIECEQWLPHNLAFTALCVLSMYTECLISSWPHLSTNQDSQRDPINNTGPSLRRLGVS